MPILIHCYSCNSRKSVSEFYPDRSRSCGYSSRCKKCSYQKEVQARYRRTQKRKEQSKRYQEKRRSEPRYKERKRDLQRIWARKNSSTVRERRKRSYQENYAKNRVSYIFRTVVRKLLCRQQKPIWADNKKIREYYAETAAKGLTVDHIIPLKSPLVCGLHSVENFQMLTREENSAKGIKFRQDGLPLYFISMLI